MSNKIKIGYMALGHAYFWDNYWPWLEESALFWSDKYKEYLSQFGEICDIGKLVDSPERGDEAARYFNEQHIDVVIMVTITYSTPDDVLLALKDLKKPVILWMTAASPTLPPDLKFDRFKDRYPHHDKTWFWEHGACGTPGILSLMEMEKMNYFFIAGHRDSESVKESFRSITDAIYCAKRLWGARIGQVGHLFPGMIDFGHDPTQMFSTFGVTQVPILDWVFTEAFEAVEQKDVDAMSEEIKEKYTIAHEFQDKEFENSMRLIFALRRVIKENKLDALTMYCQSLWNNKRIGVVPCLGMSMLMQEGVFFSCEGDLPTALSGLIMHHFGAKPIFTEIWLSDFEKNQFNMGHSGTMNLGYFENTKDVRVKRHPWWDGRCGRGACVDVGGMPHGEVTMLGITAIDGNKWRMIAATANVVDRPPLDLGCANFFLEPERSLEDFIRDWGKSSAGHHLAMCYGDRLKDIEVLAKVLGIQYVRI